MRACARAPRAASPIALLRRRRGDRRVRSCRHRRVRVRRLPGDPQEPRVTGGPAVALFTTGSYWREDEVGYRPLATLSFPRGARAVRRGARRRSTRRTSRCTRRMRVWSRSWRRSFWERGGRRRVAGGRSRPACSPRRSSRRSCSQSIPRREAACGSRPDARVAHRAVPVARDRRCGSEGGRARVRREEGGSRGALRRPVSRGAPVEGERARAAGSAPGARPAVAPARDGPVGGAGLGSLRGAPASLLVPLGVALVIYSPYATRRSGGSVDSCRRSSTIRSRTRPLGRSSREFSASCRSMRG